MFSKKSGSRRAEIRRKLPDAKPRFLSEMRAEGATVSLGIAAIFCVAATLILSLRDGVMPYRPGQYTPNDIVSRVSFSFNDKNKFFNEQELARRSTPREYKEVADVWEKLEDQLVALPDRVANVREKELPPALKVLDAGALTKLQEYATRPNHGTFNDDVEKYVDGIRNLKLIIIPDDQRKDDVDRIITLPKFGPTRGETTLSPSMKDELRAKFAPLAQKQFVSVLQPKIVELTLAWLQPTHVLDEQATAQAQNVAADNVPRSKGDIQYEANQKIISKGEIHDRDVLLLKTENDAFLATLGKGPWRIVGTAGMVALLTLVLCGYTIRYQSRVVRNHMRAIAMAGLLLSMLLVVQLAGLGSSPTYVFGIAPAIVVAMIVTIAYDQRYAAGVSMIFAVFATMALNEDSGFFLILMSGALTATFLLEDIRTRSKLIEVGGAAAVAMILATAAAGAWDMDPIQFIFRNCLYAGAAGLGVGFVVLGILPFIERAFRITTSMTLLELADASQPLLRRLSLEAPGTYNHSLQVATLSEEAAEAIGANSLACRVGAYYHDIGKINKAEYFIENQSDGQNRHINLSPSVSLLIIIGHVKDGMEMAREYNLPTSLFPFIQQHHGTTLVEFFYHRACQNETRETGEQQPTISETQYRYPGPKPKSKEVAVVMLADAVESATRAMSEPTASRIETLVHDLAMKRLMDGQFDECDLTMRDLERIERSLVKTLLGIYHGRIAYPTKPGVPQTVPSISARTA